jgi:YD repeat-containing protein
VADGRVVAAASGLPYLLIGILAGWAATNSASAERHLAKGDLAQQRSTASYVPRHKGHIDLSTGLYIRADEDLVVPGDPPLVLRRTYLSGYRVSRQFGIGTTHEGEWYLIGDGQQFQWAELILATGSRVRFERVSPGTSILNAVYEHRRGRGEWRGARLRWALLGWAVERADGAVMLFHACAPNGSRLCSIAKWIGPDGRKIEYWRNASGRLLRMTADPDRWIAFDYDEQNRITRAYDQAGREVRYQYDTLGRLTRVNGLQGRVHLYSYTDRDELATIIDPGTTIENFYDDYGHCIRQVNRYPNDPDPFVFEFSYRTENGSVVQSDTKRSDDSWTRYTFGKYKALTSEAWGEGDTDGVSITYYRDPLTNGVTRLTVTCADEEGRQLRHSSVVTSGNEEQAKHALLQAHCR